MTRELISRVGAVVASAALALALCTGLVFISTSSSMAGEDGAAVVSNEGGLVVGDEASKSQVDSKNLSKGLSIVEDDRNPLASMEDLSGGSATSGLMRGIGISVAAVVILLAAGCVSMMLTSRKRRR